MAGETTTPNMSLVLPGPSVTSGPTWSSELNAALTVVDSHDHSSGSGVQISSAGLNIASDLTFNNSNLTNARSLRLYAQSAVLALASDLGCLYEVGVDLYYNDGNGTQIRMTQSGGVAGTPGSIGSLTSPATATYSAGSATFIFQSAASVAANLDGRNVLLRNSSASSFACTLSPPAAMGANFGLTLPSLPASQKFMTLDAAGNMSAPWAVDASTVEISSNTLQIKDLGVSTAKIADAAVTPAKLAALGQQLSSSSGSFTSVSTTPVAITNLSVSITTTGRPVMLMLVPAAAVGNNCRVGADGTPTAMNINLYRGGVSIFESSFTSTGNASVPPSAVAFMDTPAAGTYTYAIYGDLDSGTTMKFINVKLVAYEL